MLGGLGNRGPWRVSSSEIHHVASPSSHEPRKPKKIVRITDTLHLGEMYVSEAALEEIKDKVEILGEPQNLFDVEGSLTAF